MVDGATLPFLEIIARHLGPPPGRRGERSNRAWWGCPFHPDGNPSLTTTPAGDRYHCFGCGAHGDAIDFVRKLDPSLSFREARAIVGGDAPTLGPMTPPRPRPRPEPLPRPGGWQGFARTVVERAEAALWSDRGSGARAYLRARGLTDATIRAARLGLWVEDSYADGVFPDNRVWVPRGITIPWYDGVEVAMVNVRRPAGSDPKYWAVRGSRRGGIYPSRDVIVTGRPLIIVEGEFESWLLIQELAGLLAPAITLGTAGDQPSTAALDAMLGASPWLVAVDADRAGKESAFKWLDRSRRCRRVRPPGGFKDWTEALQGGVGLYRWWGDYLAGVEVPLLHTWAELAALRWGPAVGDSTPGRIVDRPDRARMLAALSDPAAAADEYAFAERASLRTARASREEDDRCPIRPQPRRPRRRSTRSPTCSRRCPRPNTPS
jgi:hypothetical protein